MADGTYIIVDVNTGIRYPMVLHDNGDGTYSMGFNSGNVTVTAGAVTVANAADVAKGATTDAPGSSTAAEDATARTQITLEKAIKNILILIGAQLPAALAAHGGLKVEGVASGVVVPISGTVTANLSATDNAVLDAIVAALPAALAAGGGLKVEGVASGVAQPVSGNMGRSATSVTPADQATTDDFTDVTGSTLDTLNNLTASYTIINDGAATICWQVLGANAANFSDVVTVQASADILAAANSSYSTQAAVWRYYKVQVKSKVGSTPGAALVRGLTKG